MLDLFGNHIVGFPTRRLILWFIFVPPSGVKLELFVSFKCICSKVDVTEWPSIGQ